MSNAGSVVVVGGGMGGLSAAWNLRRLSPGVQVRVLEARAAPGGPVRSERVDGFLVDHGPNGLLMNRLETAEALAALGLEDELVAASPKSNTRYLFDEGRMCPFPSGFVSLLRWPVLSLGAKLRLLCEPFVPRARREHAESFHAFVSRRLGHEVGDRLAQVLLAGVSGGDARRVDAAVFFRMHGWERDHGSILVGALRARARWRRQTAHLPPVLRSGRLTSFRDGMGTLSDALVRSLGDCVQVGTKVDAVARRGAQWALRSTTGEEVVADALVLALAPAAAAPLLAEAAPQVAALLRQQARVGLESWTVGYRGDPAGERAAGFGCLCSPKEAQRLGINGIVFTSSIFPGHAPPGHTVLRVLAGGALQPERLEETREQGEERVLRALRDTLGIAEQPVVMSRSLWPDMIPAYSVGHVAWRAALIEALGTCEGLEVAGLGYQGVGVHDVWLSGAQAAGRLLDAG